MCYFGNIDHTPSSERDDSIPAGQKDLGLDLTSNLLSPGDGDREYAGDVCADFDAAIASRCANSGNPTDSYFSAVETRTCILVENVSEDWKERRREG